MSIATSAGAVPEGQTYSVNKYQFLNREKQPETGYMDLMRRFYDPTVGRFMQVDPVTETQEHYSTYHYGWNNPILQSDPNGDCPNCITGLIGAGAGALVGGAIEIAAHIYSTGSATDWAAVGGSALQGGITGGVAGLTGGASLLATAAASGAANAVGGAVNSAIQGQEITAQSVATDAAVGLVAGAGGKVLNKALNKAEGIVYLRTDKTGNIAKPYVGQVKSAERYAARQIEHTRANPKSDFKFEKIDKGTPGKDLNRKEQKALDARGGPTNKTNPDGGTSNKKNVIRKDKDQ